MTTKKNDTSMYIWGKKTLINNYKYLENVERRIFEVYQVDIGNKLGKLYSDKLNLEENERLCNTCNGIGKVMVINKNRRVYPFQLDICKNCKGTGKIDWCREVFVNGK